MKVYIVLGVEAHHTEILGVYRNKEDAENHKFTDYQYGYAFISVEEHEIKEFV